MESRESGVALRDREPVLDVCKNAINKNKIESSKKQSKLNKTIKISHFTIPYLQSIR